MNILFISLTVFYSVEPLSFIFFGTRQMTSCSKDFLYIDQALLSADVPEPKTPERAETCAGTLFYAGRFIKSARVQDCLFFKIHRHKKMAFLSKASQTYQMSTMDILQ